MLCAHYHEQYKQAGLQLSSQKERTQVSTNLGSSLSSCFALQGQNMFWGTQGLLLVSSNDCISNVATSPFVQ